MKRFVVLLPHHVRRILGFTERRLTATALECLSPFQERILGELLASPHASLTGYIGSSDSQPGRRRL